MGPLPSMGQSRMPARARKILLWTFVALAAFYLAALAAAFLGQRAMLYPAPRLATPFRPEYRGYAGNPGSPSEEGLYRDGEAALH